MRTERRLSFIMVLTAVTLISILCYAAFMKPDCRIQRFQEEFGLTLSAGIKVIFAERDYGAMGDGFCSYIYQLPPQEMSLLLQEKSLSRWRPLSPDSSLTVLTNERVNALTSSDMVKEIDFNIQNGYYIFRNTGNPQALLSSGNSMDTSYPNAVFGVINLQNDTIYYGTWDMQLQSQGVKKRE